MKWPTHSGTVPAPTIAADNAGSRGVARRAGFSHRRKARPGMGSSPRTRFSTAVCPLSGKHEVSVMKVAFGGPSHRETQVVGSVDDVVVADASGSLVPSTSTQTSQSLSGRSLPTARAAERQPVGAPARHARRPRAERLAKRAQASVLDTRTGRGSDRGVETLLSKSLGGPRQPSFDDHLFEVLNGDHVQPHQNRRVSVEMRSGEEDARVIR